MLTVEKTNCFQLHTQICYRLLQLATLVATAFAAPLWEHAKAGDGPEDVDFSRDVRPILSDKCFQCHGPAKESRQAELRLDSAENSDEHGGVYSVVIQGKASKSELIRRVTATEESEVMPPPESGKSLTELEIDILRRWINQGAEWSGHWAFVAPQRPQIPDLRSGAPEEWLKSPLDRLVLHRIQAAGLKPSRRSSPATLLRRLHLDLTGLPPTLEQQRRFLEDTSADADVQLVERLLASPHYGERWGRHWLDSARYADSDGYEKDMQRTNWFYRDWVIHAINADKPYNEFIIEQIAGDLLPGASQDELVATGFLRNSMVNEEGGADPEQFRVEGIFDRMDAIGKAVLGLTTQCAQCHSHKFDPLTQQDYYGMFAYLNACNESIIAVYTPQEQSQIESIRAKIFQQEQQLRESLPSWREDMGRWARSVRESKTPWRVLQGEREDYTGQKFAYLEDGSILSQSFAPPRETNGFVLELPAGRLTALRLELLPHPDLPRGGPGRAVDGTNALTEFEVLTVDVEGNQHPVKIASATADVQVESRPLQEPFIDEREGPEQRLVGPVSYAIDDDPKTAWTIRSGPGTQNQLRKAVFVLANPIEDQRAAKLILRLKQEHGGKFGNQRHTNIAGRFRFSATDEPTPAADPLPAGVRDIVSRNESSWSTEEWGRVFSYWRTTRPEWDAANQEIDLLLATYPNGTNQYVLTEQVQPRVTHLLERGDFLRRGEVIPPHTPGFLHPSAETQRHDRLSYARWLVDRRSPTTARALVNRVWQEYFGIGLVETTEDLGSQAPPPSHPKLLDWLAVEFMDSGWSLKHLHRLVVTSATYQQTSKCSEAQRELDPYNRLLARGPRVRVHAEVVRDIALSASGLLNTRIGGPSVFPPAPSFLFLPPASYGEKVWKTTDGGASYRRSLYVQMYRSVPYPPMQVFDAPKGDTSCVRRTRSNTPLQALTLLNEPQFVSCAQALGQRLLDFECNGDQQRIETAYRILLSRQPNEEEAAKLLDFLERCRKQIDRGLLDPQAIAGLIDETGAQPTAELAAWTLVSRCLLNLDETITKQ